MTFPSPAAVIGRRYLLQEQIGIGNMGVVFRALDRLTGQVVALKRVSTDENSTFAALETSGTNMRLALAHEFQLLASLRHPHIISVLDYGFDDERQPYYTMELLDDAKTLLGAGRDQSTETRVNLLTQTLLALAYLHRRGILHRDLKPANILVTYAGTSNGHPGIGHVKVMDFGLSVMRERQREEEMAGTPSYMAPEVLRGFPASEAADLYALGVMAYEMFVGRHPFDLPQSFNLIHNVLTYEPEFPADFDAGLLSVIRRLLAKQPEDRYAGAEDVIVALSKATGQPLPLETAATRESFLQASEFVGREAEMTRLSDALIKAMAGQGSAWLVGGESGVGKSRLMNELRTLALVKGALVLRGQAVSEGGAPYAVWRSAVQMLALLSEPSAHEAAILKPIVPTIGKMLGVRVNSAAKIDPRGAQTRMLGVVSDMLKRRDGVTVILLEDLHWADDESLALLSWLIRFVRELPVLIVASYRDDEAPDLMARLPTMQLLWLDRLSDDAIRELSEHILGPAGGTPEVVDFLHRETEGNPFFLVEVIRALAESAGELHRIGAMELPEHVFAGGVQRVVTLRLGRVPEHAHPLLEFAAVAGRAIDLNLMRIVAPNLDIDLWLADCANAAVIDVDEGHWRFAHDKLRDGVLATLSDSRLRALHRNVAEAISEAYPTEPEQYPALAYHWGEAGDAGREMRYSFLAGEQALSSGAYQKALGYLEHALELEPQVMRQTEIPPPAPLRRLLGETCYSLGNYSRARDLLRQSADLAEMIRDRATLAGSLNLLGNISLALGDYDDAREMLSRAIQVARSADSRHELGRALRSLGVVTETLGDYAEARRLFRSSLTTLSEVDDPIGMAGALANLASLARHEGNDDEARRLYKASLSQFEATGFQWGIAWTLTSLGEVEVALGNPDEARALHERAAAICEDIGHKWGEAFTRSNLANAYVALNDVRTARVNLVEALRLAVEIQTTPLILAILTSYARLTAAESSHGYAAELLEFVIQHEVVEPETLERAQPLLETVSTGLSPEQREAARQRAASRTLDNLTTEILQANDVQPG